MRNRLRIVFVAAAMMMFATVSASAADRSASVSKSTLKSMGLSQMQPLADQEGLDVRGKGFRFHLPILPPVHHGTVIIIGVSGGSSWSFAR